MQDNTIDIAALYREILRVTGMDFTHYKSDFFLRCLSRRMQSLSVDSPAEYVRRLGGDAGELGRLLETFSVYHSQFMRDPAKYRLLRDRVFPAVARTKPSGAPVTVWSAGCAGGEEPYSIAMMAREAAAGGGWRVRVHATDVNEDLLAKARRGLYPAGELRKKDIDPSLLERYFERSDGGFAVRDDVRSDVVFAKMDLISGRPPAPVDIIFCRNVLIYFDQAAVRRIILGFHGALRENGYLFLGNSEILEDCFFCHFRKVRESGEYVYRKISPGSDEYREMQAKYRNIQAGLGMRQ